MPRQKLNEILTSLHSLLHDGAQLDKADRAHLSEVLGEIRQVLESDSTKPHPTLGDRIGEAVTRLESEHPTIAVCLRETIDTLKRL